MSQPNPRLWDISQPDVDYLRCVVSGTFEETSTANLILSFFAPTSSLIAAGAVAFTAYVGIRQINKWKNEKRFDLRLKKSFEILEAVYAFRRSFLAIRNDRVTNLQIKKARTNLEKRKDLKYDVAQRRDAIMARALINRLESIRPKRDKIFSLLPAAQSMFGQDTKNALEDIAHSFVLLRSLANKVIRSDCSEKCKNDFSSLFVNVESSAEDTIAKKISDRIKKIEEVDEFEKRIGFLLKLIEDKCLPVLGSNEDETK